jgi:hypothetical protein
MKQGPKTIRARSRRALRAPDRLLDLDHNHLLKPVVADVMPPFWLQAVSQRDAHLLLPVAISGPVRTVIVQVPFGSHQTMSYQCHPIKFRKIKEA